MAGSVSSKDCKVWLVIKSRAVKSMWLVSPGSL